MTRSYVDDQGAVVHIEAGGGSAVCSRKSGNPQIHAVCHHSQQYLTRAETNPQSAPLGCVRCDFPGFPDFDKRFVSAAHAGEHQHFVWDINLLQFARSALATICLLGALWLYLWQGAHVGDPKQDLAMGSVLLLGFGGVGLLIYVFFVEGRRKFQEYRQVAAAPPAVDDFPLKCSYKINVGEHFRIDLGNLLPDTPKQRVRRRDGNLVVELFPEENIVQYYQQYRHLYRYFSVGSHFYAGVLALENLKAVHITSPGLVDEHQIVLRKPIPRSLLEGSYRPEQGPLDTFALGYTIPLRALDRDLDDQRYLVKERWRFPLECQPRLSTDDSYTLELHFRWLGDPKLLCKIEQCAITQLPPELGTVTYVGLGRYDAEQQRISWLNLTLPKEQGRSLILKVSFSEPVLKYQAVINGSFRCTLDGLVSGLEISPERLWDATGMKAAYTTTPLISRSSVVEGDLSIDIRLLQQEHEFVDFVQIPCLTQPNYELVDKTLQALDQCKVDILRVEQAAPRLDPAGTLHTQLYFWEVVGRKFNQDTLDSVDVHAVIAGFDHAVNHANNGALPPECSPQIDLRVRCLHDPRNEDTPQRAKTLRQAIHQTLDGLLQPKIRP